MDRATRRRTESKIKKIMKTDGDNCSLCRVALPHNGKTYGGIAMSGSVVLTGECCREKLAAIVVQGVYVTQEYDFVGKPDSPPTDQKSVEKAIETFQGAVSATDALASNVARRAGSRADKTRVSLKDTAWKTGDAAWFASHPDRTHRLRKAMPGEIAASFPPLPIPPSDHEFQILVRQVAVGQRIRVPFCRNTTATIPDIDEVLHAIFDTMQNQAPGARVVTSGEIGALAMQYAEKGERPN